MLTRKQKKPVTKSNKETKAKRQKKDKLRQKKGRKHKLKSKTNIVESQLQIMYNRKSRTRTTKNSNKKEPVKLMLDKNQNATSNSTNNMKIRVRTDIYTHPIKQNEDFYFCSICTKYFESESLVQHHLNIIHRPLTINIHHGAYCDKCGCIFEERMFQNHEPCIKPKKNIMLHLGRSTKKVKRMENCARMYAGNKCRICHKQLQNKSLLLEHLSESHLPTIINIETEIKTTFCKTCQKHFEDDFFTDHYPCKAIDIKCFFCLIIMPTKSHFSEHNLTWDAWRSFQCNLCEINTKTMTFSLLNEHMKKHNKHGLYKCIKCRVHMDKSTLALHVDHYHKGCRCLNEICHCDKYNEFYYISKILQFDSNGETTVTVACNNEPHEFEETSNIIDVIPNQDEFLTPTYDSDENDEYPACDYEKINPVKIPTRVYSNNKLNISPSINKQNEPTARPFENNDIEQLVIDLVEMDCEQNTNISINIHDEPTERQHFGDYSKSQPFRNNNDEQLVNNLVQDEREQNSQENINPVMPTRVYSNNKLNISPSINKQNEPTARSFENNDTEQSVVDLVEIDYVQNTNISINIPVDPTERLYFEDYSENQPFRKNDNEQLVQNECEQNSQENINPAMPSRVDSNNLTQWNWNMSRSTNKQDKPTKKQDKPTKKQHFNSQEQKKDNPYVCIVCGAESDNYYVLRDHLLWFHRPWAVQIIGNIYCPICNSWFDNKQSYLGHQPCNPNAVKRSCHICNMDFPLREHFLLHKVVFRSSNRLCCTLCKDNSTEYTLKELNVHKRTEHNKTGVFECLKCDISFEHFYELKRHLIKCDVISVTESFKETFHLQPDAVTKLAHFKCEICSKLCISKFHLRVHVSSHNPRDGHLCYICGQAFKNSTFLNDHQNVAHYRMKTFDCSSCNKKFYSRKYLTQHEKIHKDKKHFNCELCPKVFVQQTSLIYHMATHTGENVFKCSICLRPFNKQSMLTSHMEIHNKDGTNPHKCSVCNKYFSHKCNLLVHMRTHSETN